MDIEYRLFHVKRSPTTHRSLYAQKGGTYGNVGFLQPYHFLAADTLFEISTAFALTDYSLD
jgi:hypothetical protein